MNNRFVLALLAIVISTGVFAQTVNDAIRAQQGEQPKVAKNILLGILAKTPADAEANYRLGNVYYQLGKKDSARVYYEKGIKPDDKVNYNFAGLGKLALDQKDVAKAEEYFNKLTGYGKSKDTKAYGFAGEAYFNSANPDAAKAVTMLEKAVLLNLKNGEAQMLLGDAYLQGNNAGKAVTKYEYGIDADPTSAYPYLKIGQVYMKSGAYDQALKNFQKGNEIDPNFAPLYRELAEINYLTKNFAEAVRLYRIYIEKTGTNLTKETRLASFLFLNKEYDKSIQMIEGIMKQDSSNVIMSRLIGYSYYEQEKYQEGLQFMKKFFEQADPKQVIGSDYSYYGKLLAKTDNDSLAVEYLKKAIPLDSTNADLYNDLATVLYTQKKYQDAAPVYEKMMALKKPASSQDYFQLGRTYYFAGGAASSSAKETTDAAKKKELEALAATNYQEADSAFLKVTEMQPTLPTGFFWRGRANSMLDPEAKQGLAFPHYQKFIEMATDETKYKKDLVEAYSAVGYYHIMKSDPPDVKSATPAFKKVLELDPANKNAKSFFDSLEQQRAAEKAAQQPK